MPTLLLDDLHDSIRQQLGDYASSLGSAVQGAQQAIASVPLIPTPQAPDPNAILQELQQHAAAVAQAAQEQAQPAVQVLGQGVGGAVTQLGGAKDSVTQQLLQHAQDVASGAQDVNQQLQNHVQTVLGTTTPSEPGGVQSLAKPTPSPVLGAPSGDQNAPPVLGATTGAVNQPAPATPTSAAPPDRTMSVQDYARAAAQRAGIDPNVFTAQIQQESGFNPEARSPAGAIGIAQFMPETAKGVNLDPTDPYASLDAAAAEDAKRLQQYNGDWGKTLASYNAGAGAVAQYGGIPPYKETQTYVSTILDNAKKAAGGASPVSPPVTTAQASGNDWLSLAKAQLGKPYIWGSQGGRTDFSPQAAGFDCSGFVSYVYKDALGINLPAQTESAYSATKPIGGDQAMPGDVVLYNMDNPDPHIQHIAIYIGNGQVIQAGGGVDKNVNIAPIGQAGNYEFRRAAGAETAIGNAAATQHVATQLGGASGDQNAPITMGANQPARAPLVVEDQTPTPIRAAQDVLGAAGEKASQLGTTAQDLLAQAQELNRVQPGTEAIKAVTPILGGAAQAGGSAVSQVAQDVQNAAQGVLGAAQDVNRLTPGTTAVNAAAPVLGAAASDLGTGAANALLRQGRTPAEQAEFERQQGQVLGGIAEQANAPVPPLNAGDVARNAWDLVVNSSPGLPGVSLQDYQHASTVKNDWIEQNNPAKDVLLLGGLTTMIAQQVTDPYALTMFGFTGGAGRVAGEAAGEAATAATANRLGEQGAAFVGRVANKLVDGSIVGGVQNALYAAEQPDASPESVFTALWQGAALGSAAEGGTAALTPVARRIGQAIIDQAPRLRPAVAEFARSETGAAGRPEDVQAERQRQVEAGQRELPGTPAPVETAVRAQQGVDNPVDLRQSQRVGRLVNTLGEDIGPNDTVTVYHATTPEVAASLVENGFQPGAKTARGVTTVSDPSVARMLGKNVGDPLDYEPGRGQGQGVYFTTDPRAARDVYGSAIVAIDVPRSALEVPPERQTPRMTPERALLLGDGYTTQPISPDQVRLVNTGGVPIERPGPATVPAARAEPPAVVRPPTEAGVGVQAPTRTTTIVPPPPPETGFRAPVTPDDLNVRTISQQEARQLVGPAYEPSTRTTTRPPAPGEEPRRLEDVQSNPHLLREPGPGETPMTMDERLAHQDTLEQRYQANTERLAAIDEQLRNPTARPERPPWAAGFTNDQVATMAAKVGRSPYEPLWWEKAGLEAGSGEVREMVNEGGVERGRFDATRTSTPAELRAEQRALQQDQLHLEAAGEQQATAPDNARFVRPPERAAGALPFAEGGAADPGAQLAQEVVTSKGRATSDVNQVTATRGDVTGRGIVNPAEVVTEAPSEATRALMPNLNAIGKDMPEVVAQIQKSVDDNPALWEHYKQGTITFDSLKNDLAARVGMTKEDWLKTKVGQAFNDQEMVALQAAMIEEQARQTDMAKSILSKGGVDNLTPEELAYSITQLTQAQSLAAVAKGAGSTVARSLNARKVSFTRQLASDITAQNERRAAQRVKAQAARVATRAGDLLDNAKTLDQQKAAATAAASRPARPGAPRTPQNIIDQIANAYDELDRYNAMSLHEKADVFDKLKAQREAAAAARASAVRGAPEELLSALKQELKAEQDNFAKRKNTWETMAFMDSKVAENAARERAVFRGGLYIEQQRRVAQNALKGADTEINRAFDSELKRRGQQSAKAQKLLESLGGTEVTKDVLKNYLAALSDPDPMVAAKFLQSTASMSNWKRATVVRLAGLVSSPITQMVNIGGNVAGAMIEVPTRGLVVGIDALRAAATGGERQAYAGEILPMLKAYGPGFLGQWDNAYRVLKTGFTPEQLADPTKIRGAFSRSELLNAGVEAPLRLLGAADQLFRGGAMAAHSMRVATRQAIREGFSGPQVAGRAASIVKNLEDYPELAKEAADATARQVYQERRAGLGGGNKPLPDVAEFGVKQVLPFYQTPMNITAQGAALSPFGFTGALQSSLKARGMAVGTAAERTVQGRETLLAEERAARAIIGSAILGGGIALGSAGMLTGSYPIDPKEASTLPQGWRPWSLRITSPIDNNTYYLPMQNFNAAGFPLAMASILTDPQHRGKTLADPDEQLNAVTAIGRYVLDNTFLQGLSDVVNTLHDPKSAAQKFGEGLAASYGPYSSLGREMQRIQGVATRNPHNGFVGLWEALESNYPGASANVPEATTPLGEPRTQGATGIARVVPYRYDIERDTPLLQQLRESGVGIPTEHKSLNYGGQHIDLTEDEQDVLKRQRGEALKQYLDPYVNDPKFQNLSQAERNRYLTVLVSHAVQYADHQFLNDMPGADLSSRLKPKTVPDPYYLGDAGAAA